MAPPSLVSLCVLSLLPYADSLDALYPHRLRPSRALLAELINADEQIDPRLWAILVQIFNGLPEELRASLEADLADPRIESVLRVRTTPSFELLTVIELPGCRHLTDDAVAKLFRGMHSLAAIDASDTTLSAYAIQSLASALDDDGQGPWKLSVLFLRNCKSVTNDVYAHLTAFPLLSVVDLSATLCSFSRNAPFKLSIEDALFHPTPILTVLSSVHNCSKFSVLHISSFSKPPPPPPKPSIAARASQDSFVIFSSSQVQFGNTNTLAFEEESTSLTPTFNIPVKVPKLRPPPSQSTSSFYQSLPKSHTHRRRQIPTNLRLARPPPPDPHIALKTAQSLHTQLRHQNRALRSNLDPDALGAEIDRSSDRAKHARIALDDVLKRRMESTHGTSTPVDIPRRPSQERLASRNPFRKSCSSGAGAGDSPQAGPLVRSLKVHVSTSDSTSTLQMLLPPSSQPTPTLKPISSLKPPSLPPALRTSSLAASGSAQRSEKRRESPPSESLHKKRSRADSDDEDVGNDEAKAKGPAKPRMRMSLGSASKQKGKPSSVSHQQPQGFDWKAWSRGRRPGL